MKKKTVLIATPSEPFAAMVGEFVRIVAESKKDDCAIFFAYTPGDLHGQIVDLKPDVILVDAYAWRYATGFALAKFVKQYKKHKFSVFCFDDIRLIHAAQYIYFGAENIIGFRRDAKARSTGLEHVIDGKRYVPADVEDEYQKIELARDGKSGLSKTELKVLRLMLEGCNEDAIAANMNIAKPTVHTHKKSIYKTLGTKNNYELFIIGQALGLVNNETPEWAKLEAMAC